MARKQQHERRHHYDTGVQCENVEPTDRNGHVVEIISIGVERQNMSERLKSYQPEADQIADDEAAYDEPFGNDDKRAAHQ